MSISAPKKWRLGSAALVTASVATIAIQPAMAITDIEFRYSPIPTGYYTLSPADFSPADGGSASRLVIGPRTLTATGSEATCLVSGLHLPHDATMQNLLVYYKSNSSSDISIKFQRLTIATGASAMVTGGTIADDTNARRSKTFGIPGVSMRVNNTSLAYSMTVCLAGGTSFEGARITYLYQSAGD